MAEKTAGAQTGTTTFDPARRPTSYRARAGAGPSRPGTVFEERLAWSPRSLKVGLSRPDHPDGGEALTLAHDGAGRLLRADRTATVPQNNSTPAGAPTEAGFAYVYDAAQNLLAKTEREAGVETTVQLPLDGSGRNRPGALDGVALDWDAQGNLVQKGDLRLHYDYRNRLTRVTRSDGSEVASYAYDAFNRKVRETKGGATRETAWAGWQPLERYEDDQLAERRTYGVGLDEIVRLEKDLDGDGALEQSYTPLYDHTGNLALLADEATGKPVERYRYTPYGERTVLVDSTPPEVEQV